MRYLRLMILAAIFGLFNTTGFAQVCCPAGCVQDSNRCVTTGPNPRTCNSVPCAGGSPGSGGGGSGQTYVVYPTGPFCSLWYQTQAARDAATDQCVAQLRGSAQFWGCLFEDDAGRAEDRRTGLSCVERQAALANQCRARCARYAASMSTCVLKDEVWQRHFGDIGGVTFGSARIELCGPRLRSAVRQPFTPEMIRRRPRTP